MLFCTATDLVEVEIIQYRMNRRLGGFQSLSGGSCKRNNFVAMFFLFSSLIVPVLRQRQYYKLLVTTGITVKTIQFNTNTVSGSDNAGKTAEVFSSYILPGLRC